MGNQLLVQQGFARLGRNTDPTDKLDTTGAFVWCPHILDSFSLFPEVESVEVNTAHRYPGPLHSITTKRGANEGGVTFPVYPENAQTLLGAIFDLQSSGLTPFNQLQWLFKDDVLSSAASQIVGKDQRGVIFVGLSIDIDFDNPGEVRAQLQGYVHDSRTLRLDADFAGTLPTPTWPVQAPLKTSNLIVDLAVADAGATDFSSSGAWTGKHADVKRVNIQLTFPAEVSGFTPDSVQVSRSLSWADITLGPGTLTATVTARLKDQDYLTYNDAEDKRLARLRLMAKGATPSGSTTVNEGGVVAASATTSTVTVTDAAGFAVGDYVILDDGTNQCVSLIEAIVSNDIDLATVDCQIADGAVFRNTAMEIKVPKMDLVASPPQPAGNGMEITFNCSGKIDTSAFSDPDAATIAILKAYNDDLT